MKGEIESTVTFCRALLARIQQLQEVVPNLYSVILILDNGVRFELANVLIPKLHIGGSCVSLRISKKVEGDLSI